MSATATQAPPKIWCLHILTAHPDWKRPYARAILEHHPSEEAAEASLRKHEDNFLERRHITRESFLSGDYVDRFYEDGYMEMRPFESEIFEVGHETDEGGDRERDNNKEDRGDPDTTENTKE